MKQSENMIGQRRNGPYMTIWLAKKCFQTSNNQPVKLMINQSVMGWSSQFTHDSYENSWRHVGEKTRLYSVYINVYICLKLSFNRQVSSTFGCRVMFLFCRWRSPWGFWGHGSENLTEKCHQFGWFISQNWEICFFWNLLCFFGNKPTKNS